MTDSWRGKVVWVTGASSGIGRATAEQLLDAGALVVLSARRRQELEAVAARAPERALVLPLDVRDAAALAQACADAEAWQGRIDALVLNAGVSQRAPALETSDATVRDIMDINFFAPVAMTRAVAPGMVARGAGRVVVVTSVVGYVATPLRSTYAASKHALHGYFDALRAELAGSGVTVTLVVPGYINTEIALGARTADGGQLGHKEQVHQSGLDASVCARRMLDAAARGRREAIIGGKETWSIYLQRFTPGLVAKLAPRAIPK